MRFLLLAICCFAAAANAAPRVVTSVEPLHELTLEIMRGVGQPQVIIGGNASTHHFAFKPSHLLLLQNADLLIFIDRHFEAGFARITNILPPNAHSVELMPALGIDDGDGHIWYSPSLLIEAVGIIGAELGRLDPANREIYRRNADRLDEELRRWREQALQRLQKQQPRYLTDHAFSGHFETDLGLKALATVHDHHDSHGGLRQLKDIESVLRQTPAACLLTLENPPSALARSLAEKYRLRTIYLDPGAIAGLAPSAVLGRLEQLLAAVIDCR